MSEPNPTAERAIEQAFVERHLRPLWRYLRVHGASPEEADDLAQEAFIVALQKGAAHLEPAAGWTFVRRAARFGFLHHLRDRRRDPALADAVDELWQRDCEVDGGEGLLAALADCVAALDGRARRAIEGSYGLGGASARPRDDVAAEMGLEPNGLKTLLQRTRRLLRACIERRSR